VTGAELSVVIPTIGRPELIGKTLESLAACEPRPAEVIVVDQSGDSATAAAVSDVELHDVRVVASRGRGRGLALNEGLDRASHELVLVVDDDCTVRSDWVTVAAAAMAEDPGGIVSGRVLPAGGDPRMVPSTILLDEPRSYEGGTHYGALYGGNMACPRAAVSAIGGFDEAILPAAEDCDFCYRWLRSGGRVRHVPELVVWHHDWRSPEELKRHYVGYHQGLGMFYAKHLRAGDLRMLRFLAADYYEAVKSLYSHRGDGTPRWSDQRRGVWEGTPRGLRAGWRTFSSAGGKRLAHGWP